MSRLPDIFTTARLRARRIEASDVAYVIRTDSDITIQATVFGRTFSEDESRARLGRWIQIEVETGLGFYLFELPDGEIVGHAGVFPSRSVPGDVEVGYILLPEFWGRGYATEMTLALLAYVFDLLSIERVVAVTGPDNAASRRVMEKAGLEFEADFMMNGELPAVRYAIDRERWYRRTAERSA